MAEVAHIEDISLDGHTPRTLLQLLRNPLILYHTIPFLPVASVFSLARVSKGLKELLYHTPNVFRHLDLTQVKAARSEVGLVDAGGEVWRNVQVDENVTEDDFYGGPLQGIFNNLKKRDFLKDVQTLILDGLTVPSDLVAMIILDQSFSVKILSIREVQHLNEAKLMQALQYAVRPSRPANTPRLQGLYIFGPKDHGPVSRFRGIGARVESSSVGVMTAQGAQLGAEWNRRSGKALWEGLDDADRWYQKTGKVISRPISDAWASTVYACQGVISFDAVLCNGPRHSPALNSEQEINSYLPPSIATFAIRSCSGCDTAPEGFSCFGSSPLENFPLLSPPPIHSSYIKTAKTPSSPVLQTGGSFLARCSDCLRQRHCDSCHDWWCESCYQVPNSGGGFSSVTEVLDSARDEIVKVHIGLCVEKCLIPEMMSGAGSNGMWA